MEICCTCPNGHKLNLKSNLAGRRGICPVCGVSFIISGQEVDAGARPGANLVPPPIPPLPPSRAASTASKLTDLREKEDEAIGTEEIDDLSAIVVQEQEHITNLRRQTKKHVRIVVTFLLGVMTLGMLIAFILVLMFT